MNTSNLPPAASCLPVPCRAMITAALSRLRRNAHWSLLACFLTLGLPSRSHAQLYGPGKFDRIELQITSGTSGTGEKKSTIILNDPQGELTIIDSTFPNGQNFDPGQGFGGGTRFTGKLKLNYPANTPPVDAKTAFFNPLMSASLDLSGVWTGPPTTTVVARGLLVKPSLNAVNCPQTPRVDVGPAANTSLRMDIHSECSEIKALDGGTGAMPKETLLVAHSLMTFDLGQFGSASASVLINVIYRAQWRPQIAVSQAPLRFTHTDGQPLPPAQTLIITNTGGLPLTWTATPTTTPPGGKWLKVSPASGTLASDDRTPSEVSIDPTGLAPGDYTGTVTVDGDAYGGSKSVSVTFKFTGTPKLTVTPSSLEFFNRVEFPEQTLTMKNEGSARLVWSGVTTSDGNWLSTRPTGDELLPGQSKTIRVLAFVFGASLNPGDYSGQILFEPYKPLPGNSPNGADFPPVPIAAMFHVLPPMDELLIQAGSVQPSTDEPVKLNTEYTNFRADVTCRLGTRNDADLALRLFDEDGNLQASSDFVRVFKSDGRVTSKRLTLQKFKITPDAAGKVPQKLFLRAALIDRSLLTPILKTPEADYIYSLFKVELRALEVTQGVQDWNNSVPLLVGRTTFVRAHLATGGTKPVKVEEVKLHVTRNGVPLPSSPLQPFNPAGFVTAQPKNSIRRDQPESSANFLLPPEWGGGPLTLRFEAKGVTCRADANTPDKCTVQVNILDGTDAPELEVRFVAVRWTDSTGQIWEPELGDIISEQSKLISLYPVRTPRDFLPSLELTYKLPGPVNVFIVVSELAAMRSHDGLNGSSRVYMGLIKGLPKEVMLSADRESQNGAGLSMLPATGSLGFDRHIVAHRLAHVLGLHDDVHGSLGNDSVGQKIGWCGEQAPADTPNYPEFAEINGSTYPTLGPMNAGEEQRVYGMELLNLQHGSSSSSSRFDFRIISPFKSFDLMSYCGVNDDGSRFTWPSKYSYEALLKALRQAKAVGLHGPKATQDYLLITGLIDWKQQTGQFHPFVQVKGSTAPALPVAGDYSIQFRNAAGSALLTVPFQPLGLTYGPEPTTPDLVPFLVQVPADPAIRQVALLHGNTVLATRIASANPPSVQVLFPNGGETVSTDSVTFRWQGSDPDGDPLAYDVQFSADGGANWETIVLRLTSDSFEIRQHHLAGTAKGMIRVIASDGFHTAFDTSNATFTVPNHNPWVTLLAPTPGSLLTGAQQVLFLAQVLDPDGPAIDEAKIEWRSSLDGVLGTGSSLQRSATTLSEGIHTISVTATDSGGAAATASVNIVVARVAPAELTELELSSANGPVNALLGDNISFAFTVGNHGPNSATGVKVTNPDRS